MSKFFTSVFLIAAMLVSGLSSLTSTIPASAAGGLANPVECGENGVFKNRTLSGAPCKACPTDFYCLNTLTKIEKGEAVGRSPEMPGKDGNLNSEVVPCPAGKTTKGATIFPFGNQKYRIVKDNEFKNNDKVGEYAFLPDQCVSPEFKCADDEVIVEVDKKPTCSKNCSSLEALVILNGRRDCFLKCLNGLIPATSGCIKECPKGEIMKNTGVSINGKQQTECVSICIYSSIQGQIPNEVGSCVCPVGKSVILDSLNSNTGKCGVPVPCPIEGQIKSGEGLCFCEPPRTLSSDKKSCDLPVEPCGRNTYGTNKPNCKPCPDGSKSLIGQAITMDDCVSDPCTVAGQTRIAGKCQCSAGKIVNLDQTICITPEVPCSAKGQIKNYNGTCVCPEKQEVSKDGEFCKFVPLPCGVNTYGDFKPNCKPCPIGSRAATGTALVIEDCNYDPCTISGQIRTAGKCVCPEGTVISSNGYYCEKPSVPCQAKGQIKSGDGECFCPFPTILNASEKVCAAPPAVCPVNTFGEAQPNCTPCPKDSKSVQGARSIQDCVFDPCPAFGQVRKDNVCGCSLPAVLNPSGNACEIPAVPCKENQYGIKEPNCKPCPANFTSTAGKAIVEKDCVANKCNIPGQIRFYDGNCQCPNEIGYLIIAANNSKSCGQCPADNTIAQAGKEPTGENQFKCNPPIVVAPKTESGPSGICGGGWGEVLCYAVGAYVAYDTFSCGGWITVVQCDSPKPAIETVTQTTKNQTAIGPRPKIVTEKWQTAANKCSGSNNDYIVQAIADAKSANQYHPDSDGEYVWIKTASNDGKKADSFSTTIINGQNEANKALQCLMIRYAGMKKTGFGSKEYVDSLARSYPTQKDNILHGFNRKVKAECLNLTKLQIELLGSGEINDGINFSLKYSVYVNNQKVTNSYLTKQDAVNEYKSKYPQTRPSTNNNIKPNYSFSPDYKAPNGSLTFSLPDGDAPQFLPIENTQPTNQAFNYDYYPTQYEDNTSGFLNIFDDIKVSAMDDMENIHLNMAMTPQTGSEEPAQPENEGREELIASNIGEEELPEDEGDLISSIAGGDYGSSLYETELQFENPDPYSRWNEVAVAESSVNGNRFFLFSKDETIANSCMFNCEDTTTLFAGSGSGYDLQFIEPNSEFAQQFTEYLIDNNITDGEAQKVETLFAAARNTKFTIDSTASSEFLLFDIPSAYTPADPRGYDFGTGDSINSNGFTWSDTVIPDYNPSNSTTFNNDTTINLNNKYDFGEQTNKYNSYPVDFDTSNQGYPTINEPTSGGDGPCFIPTGCNGGVQFPKPSPRYDDPRYTGTGNVASIPDEQQVDIYGDGYNS